MIATIVLVLSLSSPGIAPERAASVEAYKHRHNLFDRIFHRKYKGPRRDGPGHVVNKPKGKKHEKEKSRVGHG